jgi:hypothetical protein
LEQTKGRPIRPKAEVFIIFPADGEISQIPERNWNQECKLLAGTDKPHSGHHHLLIDVKEMPDPCGDSSR